MRRLLARGSGGLALLALLTAAAPAAGPCRFKPWWGLLGEERRIFEASTIGFGGIPFQGRALYEALADTDPLPLANALNQFVVLGTTEVAPGRRAITYVRKLDELRPDRFFATVEPGLRAAIAAQPAKWLGPEDTRAQHGRFAVGYRENRAYTSQQLCFDGDTQVEIDLDEECPTAADAWATTQHLARATGHAFWRVVPGEQASERTDPIDMFARLQARGLQPGWSPR